MYANNAARLLAIARNASIHRRSVRCITIIMRQFGRCARRLRLASIVYTLADIAVGLLVIPLTGVSLGVSWRHCGSGNMDPSSFLLTRGSACRGLHLQRQPRPSQRQLRTSVKIVSQGEIFFKMVIAEIPVCVCIILRGVSLQRPGVHSMSRICGRKRCVRRLRRALTVYALTETVVGPLDILLNGDLNPSVSWRRFGIGSMGQGMSPPPSVRWAGACRHHCLARR